MRLALFSSRTQFHCRQSWICFKLNKITKRSWQRLGMEILPTKDTQKQGEDFKESKSVDPPPYEESNNSLWVESVWELKNTLRLAILYPFLMTCDLFLLSHTKKEFYAKLQIVCAGLNDCKPYQDSPRNELNVFGIVFTIVQFLMWSPFVFHNKWKISCVCNDTGKSLWEAPILASINPLYDNKLIIELQ